MKNYMRWNQLGLFLLALLVLAGEIIWLPDALFPRGTARQWIEQVDQLVRFAAVIPLIWLSVSLRSLSVGAGGRTRQVLAVTLAILSGSATVALLFAPDQWLWTIGSLAGAGIAALILLGIDAGWAESGPGKVRKMIRKITLPLLLFALLLTPTPYNVTYPGLTLSMNAYAQVEGSTAKGELLGVLVFSRPAFPVDWLYTALFNHYEIWPRPAASLSISEELEMVRNMQLQANDIAQAFALHRAGAEAGSKVPSIRYLEYLLHRGGPSHGAMLALTLLNQLSDVDLTYGNKVAGTGTIDEEGRVGMIGGIRQKAYSVSRVGVDVFFVPRGQEERARMGAPNLNIVPVESLDEMLAWLADHPKLKS